ncbi:MAG: hypothetical protein AAF959_00580 [Cyanobacteria bacterium P01_D01_bin.56]
MTKYPVRELTHQEQAQLRELVVDAFIEELTEPEAWVPGIGDLIKVMQQSSYVPHPAFDRLLEMSALAGAEAYVSGNLRMLEQEVRGMRQALFELRLTEDKSAQLNAVSQLLKGGHFVLRYFHKNFPKPPFLSLENLLPVPNIELGILYARSGEVWGQLDEEFHSMVYDLTLVKRYVGCYEQIHQPSRRKYLKRFYYWLIVNRCRRVKRARFLKALNRLMIATDGFHSFLSSYLSHSLYGLEVRKEFDEPGDFH